jgi:hypothetical protein
MVDVSIFFPVYSGQFQMLSPTYTAFIHELMSTQQLVVVSNGTTTASLPAVRLPPSATGDHGPASSAGTSKK